MKVLLPLSYKVAKTELLHYVYFGKVKIKPEKPGAWLCFASYNRLERVRFCITLIMSPWLNSEHLLLIAHDSPNMMPLLLKTSRTEKKNTSRENGEI